MGDMPFRGGLESAQNAPPAGIILQRENGPIDTHGIDIRKEQRRVFGIAHVALEELRRLEDETAIYIDRICRINECEIATGTVVVEEVSLVRMRGHPGGGTYRHALEGYHGRIVREKGTGPEPEKEAY